MFKSPLKYVAALAGLALVVTIGFLSRGTGSEARDAAATPEAMPAAPADTSDTKLEAPAERIKLAPAPPPGPEVVEAEATEPKGPELTERQKKGIEERRLNTFNVTADGEITYSTKRVETDDNGRTLFICDSDCIIETTYKGFVTLKIDELNQEVTLGGENGVVIPYGHMDGANLTFKVSVDVGAEDAIFVEMVGKPGVIDVEGGAPMEVAFVVNVIEDGKPKNKFALEDFIALLREKITNIDNPAAHVRLSAQPAALAEVLRESVRASLGWRSYRSLEPKTLEGKAVRGEWGINEEALEAAEAAMYR